MKTTNIKGQTFYVAENTNIEIKEVKQTFFVRHFRSDNYYGVFRFRPTDVAADRPGPPGAGFAPRRGQDSAGVEEVEPGANVKKLFCP
jgi:hypothetical protein